MYIFCITIPVFNVPIIGVYLFEFYMGLCILLSIFVWNIDSPKLGKNGFHWDFTELILLGRSSPITGKSMGLKELILLGTEGNAHSSRISDFGVLEQYLGFRIGDTANGNPGPVYNTSIQVPNLQPGTYNEPTPSSNMNISVIPGSENPHEATIVPSLGWHKENWGESNMADTSSHTDTSTDGDQDDRVQRVEMGQSGGAAVSDSSEKSKEKSNDQKTLRRLAQNREAARKSRLRKKAYIQQLENSRLKLTQLEQELQKARQQGIFISNNGDQSHSSSGNGALAFDAEYTRWLDERNKQVNELRSAVNAHASDTELRLVVDNVTTHFNDIFRIKSNAAKADVFHILSGMWKTPAERCFMWIGGFRPSELLKLLVNQLEPLTEQQVAGLNSLQQTSHQAEDALSQGMEALQQSLADTLASGSSGNEGSSGNVANYMGQMAMAMGKLGTLEGFVRQADNLRQQTLQQMHRILTTRQSARALLAISEYFSRLRALSSLWLARPRE
ncbi:DNA-binding transcription factor [Lithospermum erythrorhizon]|uniref:DNA-binding transcription factor n=1 Tax=Lithospermum erythrorhizon TaxID=34254 RepID=A0AAV3NWH6_LITER